MTVTAESPSATRSNVRAHDHELVIDEPPIRHGTDEGPTPLETLPASFAGCTNVILNRIAAGQKITISNVKVRVTGHLDRRGIDGEAVISNVFPEIELGIACRMRGAPDDLGPVQQALRQRCPVSVLLRASGSTIKEIWDVSRD
jgi:putative redox protein